MMAPNIGHKTLRSAIIITLIASLFGFVTIADFAKLDTSTWMRTDGVITAHEGPYQGTFAAAGPVHSLRLTANTKLRPFTALLALFSTAPLSSSHLISRPDITDRSAPGLACITSGRSPPHSPNRI